MVEQNSTLKKEVAIAERKLSARNERIESLEQLLHEAQDNYASQNLKFEQQLQLVRERLEQARIPNRSANPSTINSGSLQGKIAKPLRGGGGGGLTIENKYISSHPIIFDSVLFLICLLIYLSDLWLLCRNRMDRLRNGLVGFLIGDRRNVYPRRQQFGECNGRKRKEC